MRSISTAYGTGSFIRVPPSLAYSATTPAFRLFTVSMNWGGQDHSRPTNRPTFTGAVIPSSASRGHPAGYPADLGGRAARCRIPRRLTPPVRPESLVVPANVG